MLRTLDPHSNFFDAREYQLMREEQKGHYYGVGMQVGPQPNGKPHQDPSAEQGESQTNDMDDQIGAHGGRIRVVVGELGHRQHTTPPTVAAE